MFCSTYLCCLACKWQLTIHTTVWCFRSGLTATWGGMSPSMAISRILGYHPPASGNLTYSCITGRPSNPWQSFTPWYSVPVKLLMELIRLMWWSQVMGSAPTSLQASSSPPVRLTSLGSLLMTKTARWSLAAGHTMGLMWVWSWYNRVSHKYYGTPCIYCWPLYII